MEPQLLTLCNIQINTVACGWDHTVLTSMSGEVWCKGDDSFGQCSGSSEQSQIDSFQRLSINAHATIAFAGFRHSAIVDSDGQAWLWGDNSRGQCAAAASAASPTAAQTSIGMPSTSEKKDTVLRKIRMGKHAARASAPSLLAAPSGHCPCAEPGCSMHIRLAALGCRHSIFLTACGLVLSMGDNAWGQCGRGHCSRSESLGVVLAKPPTGTNTSPQPATAAAAAAGAAHVTADGEKCVLRAGCVPGADDEARAGALEHLVGATSIVSGWHFAAAACSTNNTNQVYTWGQNTMGQLGLGHLRPGVQDREPCARLVSSLPEGCFALAAGSNHILAAVGDSGRLFSWGWNEHGNLGLGNSENALTPTQVAVAGAAVAAVGAGGAVSYLKTTGK